MNDPTQEGKYGLCISKLQSSKKSVNLSLISKEQGLHDISINLEPFVCQEDQKRNLIYGSEPFNQQDDDNSSSTLEENNQMFEMVFLNKPRLKDSLSTEGSYSRYQTQTKYNHRLSIYQFQIGKKLGTGKFGEVFVARHIKTGFLVALKRIDKLSIDHRLLVQLIREIKIQSYLNHPNIIKLYTFFSDQRYIYLTMELCCSGQLYSFLKKKRKLSEQLTKVILKDTLKALDYMHERQIIHRDIKPQNIIYQCGMIKLCDFGWSISSKTMRQTFCGTPLYVSPELLKRKNYNNKIDVWSIGILTYQLLFGRVPFDITTEKDFIKIVEDQIKFSKATSISKQAKQFILICLKKDPRDRFTVPELLNHPFISNLEPVHMAQMF